MPEHSATIRDLCREARAAARVLASAADDRIIGALNDLAALLRARSAGIIAENKKDLAAAQDKDLAPAFIDRLNLDKKRIESLAASVEKVAALKDPVGEVLEEWTAPGNGLRIQRVSVPIGVLGMIYESRPNVTVDAAALSLKSHNAIILRGGSESFQTSSFLCGLIRESLDRSGLPAGAVSMLPSTDREMVGAFLAAGGEIDLMIPRGGRGLTERVMTEARMPVLAHLDGICHVYLDGGADPEKAVSVTVNAKMRRTGICGAAETLLIDRALPEETAKSVIAALLAAGCAVRGDERAQALDARITPAREEDWSTEYLDAVISVRFVEGVKGAVRHINHYGSHHTESIVTEAPEAARYFLEAADSAIVMHNASTQFADGGEFGMGAEIGIATGRLHARGPVGIRQLTTYKYRVHGNGQTRL